MFPPGRSGQEIWGFEVSRFPVSLCRDPGKCLYISKDFSGTDIYHSDIKMLCFALLQIKTFFCLINIIFQNFQNFLRRNACEITIFLQFVEKMEKLKLSLSKQRNKTLRIKYEMLKIRKMSK